MHPIQFGFCVPIFAYPGARLFRTPNYDRLDVATTMRISQLADQLGYDSLWVADHLMLGRDNAIMEGWTTLAALAGSTRRARLGMIHQGHYLHHPAIAAKMTATLDQISGGRFIYFVDAGYNRAEHLAYGLYYPEPMERRIAEVVEGLQVTLALWQADRPVSLQGQYFQLQEATCTPPPVQKPHPPVWFGETHPDTLAATAKYGQGWNSVPVALPEMQRRLQALHQACTVAGREFAELEISLETQILVVRQRTELRQQLAKMLALAPSGDPPDAALLAFIKGESDSLPATLSEPFVIGTLEEVEQKLRAYIALGVSHFMLWFMDAPDDGGLRLFAEELMPKLIDTAHRHKLSFFEGVQDST
jgi:alkanesulfonate monooxygenase SsuD/methylene tetrahydromethanopterin reductase-like flavin-dependent oxidoreductase (luciferase family)